MIWDRLKRLFGGTPKPSGSKLPDLEWVEPGDNPWNLRLLDVTPVTQHMLSASENPQCADNLASLGRSDGSEFAAASPEEPRQIAAALRYRIDRRLADGVLFSPQAMEHKWAIYVHGGRILVVRSWTRVLHLVAELSHGTDHVDVTALRGVLTGPDEEPDFTLRAFDALIRTHALGLVYPVPLPGPPPDEHRGAVAILCMSHFGNLAHYATHEVVPYEPPEAPLRSDSLLHIAVARGQRDAVLRRLELGDPIDLRASGGLAPLHWSCQIDGTAMLNLLLERGAAPDVRADDGTTPLMLATQRKRLDAVIRLLDAGADPDAVDHRSFTALHRAAEMAHGDIVDALLARGAWPEPEAGGHTPQSLALARGARVIAARLEAARRRRR